MRKFVITLALLGACSSGKETRSLSCPPATDTTRVFVLRHVSAQEIVDIITDLVEASRRATQARSRGSCALPIPGALTGTMGVDIWPRLVADSRTNSVVVSVQPDHREDMDRVARLIERLDVDVVQAQ